MMFKIIDMVTIVPPNNCSKARGYEYPIKACEVLSSSNKQIIDKFFTESEDLTKSIKLDHKETVSQEEFSFFSKGSDEMTKIDKESSDNKEVDNKNCNIKIII